MLSACAMTWHAISWWSERTRPWDVGAALEFCSIAELMSRSKWKGSPRPRYGSLPGVNTTGIALGCLVHSKQSPPPWRCSRHSAITAQSGPKGARSRRTSEIDHRVSDAPPTGALNYATKASTSGTTTRYRGANAALSGKVRSPGEWPCSRAHPFYFPTKGQCAASGD
jgi:hypothetical protein